MSRDIVWTLYIFYFLSLCLPLLYSLGVTEGVMCHKNCNGHGRCVSNGKGPRCDCDIGWGSDDDVAAYKSPDCSTRTCPAASAWASVTISSDYGNTVTNGHDIRECSNIGTCNRDTGKCKCPLDYFGAACEKKGCPNKCSGHGQCMSMQRLAKHSSALPLSNLTLPNETYSRFIGFSSVTNSTNAWDATKIYGCLCDSSWEVGLLAGQRQEPEWFGPDCSKRHCPSADDPTTYTLDETDCNNITAAGGHGVGYGGNLCQVDCANRGICDYNTGECECFKGYYGHDCTLTSALAGAGGEAVLVNQEQLVREHRMRTIGIGGTTYPDDNGEYFNDA